MYISVISYQKWSKITYSYLRKMSGYKKILKENKIKVFVSLTNLNHKGYRCLDANSIIYILFFSV